MRLRIFVVLVALIVCVSARSEAATTNLPPNVSVEILGDPAQFPDYLADSPAFKNIETRADTRAPLPAALSLFAGGLGALGLFGWRRKFLDAFQRVTGFLKKDWAIAIVASGAVITIVWIALLTSIPLRLLVSVF